MADVEVETLSVERNSRPTGGLGTNRWPCGRDYTGLHPDPFLDSFISGPSSMDTMITLAEILADLVLQNLRFSSN